MRVGVKQLTTDLHGSRFRVDIGADPSQFSGVGMIIPVRAENNLLANGNVPSLFQRHIQHEPHATRVADRKQHPIGADPFASDNIASHDDPVTRCDERD